jgi:ribosome-associated translation inhibitor RaiA
MQILINSDKNIVVHEKLSKSIEAEIRRVLDRFADQLTRVEVHLRDENAEKSGPQDKHCVLEARPRHYQSLTAADNAGDVQVAVSGASEKMKRLLESTFGRLSDRRTQLTQSRL